MLKILYHILLHVQLKKIFAKYYYISSSTLRKACLRRSTTCNKGHIGEKLTISQKFEHAP